MNSPSGDKLILDALLTFWTENKAAVPLSAGVADVLRITTEGGPLSLPTRVQEQVLFTTVLLHSKYTYGVLPSFTIDPVPRTVVVRTRKRDRPRL